MSYVIDRRLNARNKNAVNRQRFMDRYKGHIKRAVCSGLEVPFESGLAIERELQQQLFQSEDAKEGLAAYVEKRTPSFKGA